MTDRRDNQPPPDGWQLPPRCCGTWATGFSCAICGQWLKGREIEPHIVLSDN